MMMVAREHADVVIVTQDNPRTESPEQILADILSGGAPDLVESDRERAIRLGLESLHSEDILLIAGKGHEEYQIIGETAHPFSDVQVVSAWVKEQESVSCQSA
jgi:UDP-N-acetylmuramoyl-L-alanyl-D-glutamate--2,6-diaminopimelate ligase